MARSAFQALTLALASPLLLAAECSPTERSCVHAGDPECTNAEYPACIDYCVARLDPATAEGAACALDPCDVPDLPGYDLCPDGFTCMSDDPMDDSVQTGTCQLAPRLLEDCNPATTIHGQVACSTGTYCKAFNDAGDENARCSGFERSPWIPADAADGACALPVREGGPCDSSWGEPGCLTCEPGTRCRPDPTRDHQLRCQRPCENSGDCACDLGPGLSGDPTTNCRSDGYCNVCVSNRNECTYREPDPEPGPRSGTAARSRGSCGALSPQD